MKRVKDGHITVPLNTLVCLYGVAPTEAVVRSMYYAGSLEREFGVDLNLAFTMEDQVLPLGLSSIFAGCGAKYSWRGVCGCVTKVTGLQNRNHEMYWYKGLDNQKVLMKWYSQRLPNKLLGGYSEAYHIDKAIEDCKSLMDHNPKYPYRMAAAFGKGGDDFMSLTNRFVAEAKAKTDSNYQVIVSNETDFMAAFEKEYGKDLPSETVSYGTEWGNSVASLAEVSASVKRSVEKLRTAEAMFTLVALKDTNFGQNLKTLREQAWLACGLYYEHDWTADGKTISRTERANWQRKIAGQISSYVDTLYDLSFKHLSKQIAKPKTDNPVVFVFNPLGWQRSEVCDFQMAQRSVSILNLSTGWQVTHEWITKNNQTFLRILATDIPALGYQLFEVLPFYGKRVKEAPFAKVKGNEVETDLYKVTFSTTGAILNWMDKRQKKDLIKPISQRFANDLKADSTKEIGRLLVEHLGDVSVTIKTQSDHPIRHTSAYTFYKNSDRIDIENRIEQNFSKLQTYAFSFNFTKPNIWHEEVGAILNAKPVSKGGHYADSTSRLDWLTLNHFVDVSDSASGITISNRDAYFMKPGNSTEHFLDSDSPQINILAGGQVDADKNLGIEAQGGDSLFNTHFSLRSYVKPFDPVESMKFALEHQNPLVGGFVIGKVGKASHSFSLLNISDPGILLWSVKPAEEGIQKGLILKYWNLSDMDKAFTLNTQKGIQKARVCTHIETDLEKLKPASDGLHLTIGHHQMKSFRVYLKR